MAGNPGDIIFVDHAETMPMLSLLADGDGSLHPLLQVVGLILGAIGSGGVIQQMCKSFLESRERIAKIEADKNIATATAELTVEVQNQKEEIQTLKAEQAKCKEESAKASENHAHCQEQLQKSTERGNKQDERLAKLESMVAQLNANHKT
jgi:hypothetical protein